VNPETIILVDGREMPDNETTHEYIFKLSFAQSDLTVQYPDGSLWYVTCGEWLKGNNA